MRYLLLLLIMVCSFAKTFSQDFGLNNTVWVYDYFAYSENGVSEIFYVGDTIAGDRDVRILNHRFHRNTGDNIIIFDFDSIYIHEADSVIEVSKDLIYFDTLYNWRAKIGDRWKVTNRDDQGEIVETLYTTLLDTFTLNIEGVPTFCQSVQPSNFSFIDTLYFGIGSRYRFMLPLEQQLGVSFVYDGKVGGPLRCFSNDIFGIIDYRSQAEANGFSFSDFSFSCGQLVSASSLPSRNNSIDIYPNPASHYLNIQSESFSIENVKVYSLQGVLMKEVQSNGQEIEMDVGGLSSGVYILLINNSYYEKVVVSVN